MNLLYVITGISLALWLLYWRISEYYADRQKPKTCVSFSWYRLFSRLFLFAFYLLVFCQLFGKQIVPILQAPLVVRLLGVLIVFLGHTISVAGRMTLGSNWTDSFDYQIKKSHALVTSGIYGYIRHPIYTGMTVAFIGAELVVGSWLFLSFLALFVGAYMQGRREEKILKAHFGKQYEQYMQQTKMLIPFIY